MADYRKMYALVCAAADEALDLLPEDPEGAMAVLQQALDNAEEMYIRTADEE